METKELDKKLPAIIDFLFEQNQIRTLFNTDTGEGYVCLSDLLKAQGSTTHPSQILPELEDLFGDGVKIVYPITDALGRPQDTIFVSDPAATYVVSRGRTEAGKRLNRWLHTEVLPALRKTGYYVAPGARIPKALTEQRARAEGIRRGLGLQVLYQRYGISTEEVVEYCWYRYIGISQVQAAKLMGVSKDRLKRAGRMLGELGIELPAAIPGSRIAAAKKRLFYSLLGIGAVDVEFLRFERDFIQQEVSALPGPERQDETDPGGER